MRYNQLTKKQMCDLELDSYIVVLSNSVCHGILCTVSK